MRALTATQGNSFSCWELRSLVASKQAGLGTPWEGNQNWEHAGKQSDVTGNPQQESGFGLCFVDSSARAEVAVGKNQILV